MWFSPLDRLDLTKVYVQAKRWQGKVGEPQLRDFVGALMARRASRGVFITTSSFQSNVGEYVNRLQQEVALIDGQRLAGLCIEFGIGVTSVETVVLKRIDSDYFES